MHILYNNLESHSTPVLSTKDIIQSVGLTTGKFGGKQQVSMAIDQCDITHTHPYCTTCNIGQ